MDLTPAIRLTSLSAYREVDFDVLIDGDISELDLTASHVHELQHQVSEEVTVATAGRELTWVTGLFFFGEVDRQPSSIVARGPRLENRLDPRVEASATRRVRPGDRRRSRPAWPSRRAFATRTSARPSTTGSSSTPSTPRSPCCPVRRSRIPMRSRTTPGRRSSGSSFAPVRPVLTYASATRGFKTGGFNVTSPEAGRGFAPEWAWSYEAGVKTEFGGGRGRLNVAAFHTDYTDLQVQTPIRPNIFDISNAAAATIDGVEAEADHQAWPAASRPEGTWRGLDAKYDQYLAPGAGNVLVDVAGHRLNNTPAWSGRLWIDWTRAIGGASSLSLRADVTGKTTAFFTPVQRQRSAAIAVGLAGPQRRIRPDPSALVRGRVRAQPHQRGLHHRFRRHASARHRRPARRCPPAWRAARNRTVASGTELQQGSGAGCRATVINYCSLLLLLSVVVR